MPPPSMKHFGQFEKDLYKLVKRIKFWKINLKFEDKLSIDIKDIKSSETTFIE